MWWEVLDSLLIPIQTLKDSHSPKCISLIKHWNNLMPAKVCRLRGYDVRWRLSLNSGVKEYTQTGTKEFTGLTRNAGEFPAMGELYACQPSTGMQQGVHIRQRGNKIIVSKFWAVNRSRYPTYPRWTLDSCEQRFLHLLFMLMMAQFLL